VTLAHGGRPPGRMARLWCGAVVLAAMLTLLAGGALFATGRIGPRTDTGPHHRYDALPGLDTFLAGLLAVQVVLLVALAVTVAITVVWQAGRAHAAGCYKVRPYLCGWLAPPVTLLGIVLGWTLAALINLGVAGLLGTPVPSGISRLDLPPKGLAVPWPVSLLGVTLTLGLIYGAIIAADALYLRYRNRREFLARVDGAPSPVAAYYWDRTTEAAGATAGDAPNYKDNRKAIARAWAAGQLTDLAGAAACVIGATAVVASIILLGVAVRSGKPSVPGGWLQGLAGIAALATLVVVFVVKRRDKFAPSVLRSIRPLWDMATFWPRAVHPMAPPSYAEQAVPEIVDRIRLLTGHIGADRKDTPQLQTEAGPASLERTGQETVPAGPVLLSGYSHGSAIAAAVIAQLPPEVRSDVALLTLACPVRRLYGRAFPAYFGGDQLAALAEMLDADGRAGSDGRWKNLCRRSDYIGSWVFDDPEPCSDLAYLADHVDQACWDPVVLVPDANPAPPPIRGHAGFWTDPRTSELGAHLVDLLGQRTRAGADGTVGLREPQQDRGSASGSQRARGSVTGSSGTDGAAGGRHNRPDVTSGA
jgi:hypothetical protein